MNFKGKSYFTNITFNNKVNFNKSIFEKEAYFGVNNKRVNDSSNFDYDIHDKKSPYENEAKKRHRLNAHEDFDTLLKNKTDATTLSNEIMEARYTLKDYYTFEYFETLDNLKLFDLVEFQYKRENGQYFIKPCICEIVKLNIFDNVVKIRKIRSL